MGVFYEVIPQNIIEWILKQQVFWVATAPLSSSGHVNVSPKGGQYFGVIDEKTFWYMDLSGSGNETIAHLRENGRITIMFNAFTGAPRIVRLWGKGKFLERESAGFDDFVSRHSVDVIPASRTIVIVDVHQVGSSCGYSVPYFEFKDYRKTLNEVFEKRQKHFETGKSDESMARYWAYKSAWSMDGLPGMQIALDTGAKENVTPITKMVGPYAPSQPWGPRTKGLNSRVRYRLERLISASVALPTMLLFVLIAFLLGSIVATYGQTMRNLQGHLLSRLAL